MLQVFIRQRALGESTNNTYSIVVIGEGQPLNMKFVELLRGGL